MDELTFQRSLRDRPPADPHYRPRLSAEPGVVAPAYASETPTMSSAPSLPAAARLAAAAGVVALFGGLLLLSGILSSPSEPVAPAATSPTPTSTHELLSSMATVEVEPGVHRVDSDGIRSLARPMGTARPSWDIHRGMEGSVAVGPDGSVWWFGQDGFFRLGQREAHAWPGGRDDTFLYRDGLNPSSLTVDFEVGPDGTIWLARSALAGVVGEDQRAVWDEEVWSFDGSSWSDHEGIPADSEVIGVEVRADGDVWAAWISHTPREHVTVARLGDTGWEALPDALNRDGVDLSVAYSSRDDVWLVPGSGQPLLRYDGSSWQEQPIPGAEGEVQADVDADGTVWVRLDPLCGANCRSSRSNMLARFDGTEWEVFDAADGIPFVGEHQMLHPGFFEAARDGSVWFDPTVQQSEAESVGDDCDGVARFDGSTVTRYLRGMCVYAMSVAPDGAAWLQGRQFTDDGTQPIDTYVITPGARSDREATEPDTLDDTSVKPIQLPSDLPADLETGTFETPFGPARWVRLTGDEGSLPSDMGFLTSTPAGYVTVASGGPLEGVRSTTALWRSPDLIEWRAEPLDFAVGYGQLGQTGDTLWLSAGAAGERRGALWRSQDEETWERVSFSQLDPPGPDDFAWVAHPGAPVTHGGATVVPLTWTADYDVLFRELPRAADLDSPAIVEVAPGVFEVREIESYRRGELSAATFGTLRLEDTDGGLHVIDDTDGAELTVLEGVSLAFIERLAVEEGSPMGSYAVEPVVGLAMVEGDTLEAVELPLEVANESSLALTTDEDGLVLYAIGLDGLVHVHRSGDGRTWNEADIIGDDVGEPAGVDTVVTGSGPHAGSVLLYPASGDVWSANGRLERLGAMGAGNRVAGGRMSGPEESGDHRVTFIPDDGVRASFDLSDLGVGRGDCSSSEGLISRNTMATFWDCRGRREAWIMTLDDLPA